MSLRIHPKEIVTLIGPNGAGKSTLLKIMAGVEENFNGEAHPSEGVTVGYLPQEPQLDDSKTVRENVMDGLGGGSGTP